MSEKVVRLFLRAAAWSRNRKILVTILGVTFWVAVSALLVFLSLKLDALLNLSPFLTPPFNYISSGILFAIGLIAPVSVITLAIRGRGSPVPLNPSQKLVTSGLYAYVRNPMLTGWIVLLFGIGFLLGSTFLTLAFVPLFVLLNVVELKLIEEKELERKFGQEYLEYKRRVPMFIPRLRRPRS